MLQPFEPFLPTYLERLLKLNKNYVVSQTYKHVNLQQPGFEKTSILLSDYDDKGEAELHFKAVRHDKYAAIIDIKNGTHLNKVKEMMQPESTYQLYWAVMKSKEAVKKELDIKYKANIKRYITNNTNWRIGNSDAVITTLQVIFGELFIIIRRGTQTIRVKFEDIENA